MHAEHHHDENHLLSCLDAKLVPLSLKQTSCAPLLLSWCELTATAAQLPVSKGKCTHVREPQKFLRCG